LRVWARYQEESGTLTDKREAENNERCSTKKWVVSFQLKGWDESGKAQPPVRKKYKKEDAEKESADRCQATTGREGAKVASQSGTGKGATEVAKTSNHRRSQGL